MGYGLKNGRQVKRVYTEEDKEEKKAYRKEDEE